MKKTRLRERLSYKLDLVMSRGTTSLILFLSLITLFLVLLAGVAVILVERAWSNDSLLYAVWKSFTLTLDPGNLASVEGSMGLIFIAAVSTIGGIFITSTLISILNTGLSTRLENFQRGNARIIEKNHILILGYSELVFTMIRELQIAYENQPSCTIVILGNEDKQVMEEQVYRSVPPISSCRIICRNGDTTSFTDLSRCSAETSKSIIVNLSEDYQVIRTILAVTTYLNEDDIRTQYPASQNIHVCASINELKNLEVARIAGQGIGEVLHFKQIISRIMAHVSYQPGLSSVYTELFNYSGAEIYIEKIPNLAEKSFHDLQLLFRSSTLIGIHREGKPLLNPDPQLLLTEGDDLILIADDDRVSLPVSEMPEIDLNGHLECSDRYRIIQPENLLILGNSSLVLEILTELDKFLPINSVITLAGTSGSGLTEEQLSELEFNNLKIEFIRTDITDRQNLNKLLSDGTEHVLILSDNDLPPDQADAKTLTVLLHIRDWERTYNRHFNITTEMIDPRNQTLASVTNVNDFVISNNITSLIMTQIAENRSLAPIFSQLLNSEGSEIYLKPAGNYVKLGQPVSMTTLTHLASIKKEVFLGYKKASSNPIDQNSADIRLNPRKDQLMTFHENDWMIVLAED